MWGELHEEKEIAIRLPDLIEAGKGNRLFRELGASLHYDIYDFPVGDYDSWQSKSLLHIRLFNRGKEVDAQEDFDEIRAVYPFADRPSSNQHLALDLIQRLISAFAGEATYQGEAFEKQKVLKDWDACNDFLLKEWGEEPGSKSLRVMIEENCA